MSNRVYVYTVVGKDEEPWERVEGSKLVNGAGLLKVGQTTKGTARARIKQQLNTAYPGLKGVSILLDEPATRADGSEFSDHDVHAAIVAAGINRTGGEWFEATLDEVRAAIEVVRSGVAYSPKRTQSFGMRPEPEPLTLRLDSDADPEAELAEVAESGIVGAVEVERITAADELRWRAQAWVGADGKALAVNETRAAVAYVLATDAELRLARWRVRQAERAVQAAVRAALADGVPAPMVGAALGVTRARVYQLRDGRR